jgi:hypothetical protein
MKKAQIVTIEVSVTSVDDNVPVTERFDVLSMDDVSLSSVARRCRRLIVYCLIDFATDDEADIIRNTEIREAEDNIEATQ